MNRRRVGEDRGSKETNRCTLTLPLIVTLIITLPLDQVLQVLVTHLAVQYSLDLILFLTVNESWRWGWCRLLARDGIRKCRRQLDHREE
jgi:hypothetical protein